MAHKGEVASHNFAQAKNNMKTCNTCRQTKPLSEYPSTGYNTRVDGTKVRAYKPSCKLCHNEATLRAFNEKLDSLVSEWKCQRPGCGYDRCRDALDFHHKDGSEKEFVIAARPSISLEKLAAEISKCVLLCSNCHREFHAGLWNLGD